MLVASFVVSRVADPEAYPEPVAGSFPAVVRPAKCVLSAKSIPESLPSAAEALTCNASNELARAMTRSKGLQCGGGCYLWQESRFGEADTGFPNGANAFPRSQKFMAALFDNRPKKLELSNQKRGATKLRHQPNRLKSEPP